MDKLIGKKELRQFCMDTIAGLLVKEMGFRLLTSKIIKKMYTSPVYYHEADTTMISWGYLGGFVVIVYRNNNGERKHFILF